MYKYTIGVEGMMCGMCEAHMNDAFRKEQGVTKVNSSRSKNETVVISKERMSEEQIKSVVDGTGYVFKGVTEETYEKRGLFGRKK